MDRVKKRCQELILEAFFDIGFAKHILYSYELEFIVEQVKDCERE